MLAAAGAAAPGAFLLRAQQAVDPVANAFAAAAVRHLGPALTTHLQAALAVNPRQQLPHHQAYSHEPQHSHQQQQRQPSGGSLRGSWGGGGLYLDASSSAPLGFGNFDPGVLGGGGQQGDDLPGVCQAVVLSGCKSTGFSLRDCFCFTVLQLLHLVVCAKRMHLQAMLQTHPKGIELCHLLFIRSQPAHFTSGAGGVSGGLRAAADAVC
jgi:hypothetical protein